MKDEFLKILGERNVLAILIFLPVSFTVIFGGLFYRNLVTGVPVLVVNLDDGLKSQELLLDFDDTPEIEVIAVEGEAANITARMLELGARGAVVIPKDYSQKISRGESTAVELIIDNTNTVLGGVVTRAVQSVISTRSAEILATDRIAAGWDTYQAQTAFLTTSTRIFYNPTSGYTDFFLTVLIIHASQIAVVFTLAPKFVEEKFLRAEIFKRPVKILATKILIYTAIETAVTALDLAIGIRFFGLICRGGFVEIIFVVAIFILSVVSFALAVGAWVKVAYHTVSYTLAYIMPSILFTGAIWPRYSMDGVSLFFSYAVPIGYVANDLRNLFLKGVAFGFERHVLILILFSGICFALGILGLKFSGGVENVRDTATGNVAAD